MNNFLLIDFGASRVKSAIVNLDTGTFSHIKNYLSIPNCSDVSGHCEISLKALKEQFLSICNFYKQEAKIIFRGIVLCSQMHGFALLDKNNRPLSNYVSWKDERSLNPINGINIFLELENKIGQKYKQITGMKLRPGLPFANALHLARSSRFENGIKIISLPDWLSLCSDDSNNIIHESMMAGLGFYDIRNEKVSDKLLELAKDIAGKTFVFNTIAPLGSIAGYWHNNTDKIPIFVGVGDHQCAVLGACNKPKQTISINIGTGSQVSIIADETSQENTELRPYFNSDLLSTITHIPAGRVLIEYLEFLKDICGSNLTNKIDFWTALNELTENDIMNSTLEFDLGVFRSAWNYKDGGKISNIYGGNLTLKNYLSSLFKCFAAQYRDAIKVIDPQHRIGTYILSGGIPRKIPRLTDIIFLMTKTKPLPLIDIDETFVGLRSLSLISDKRFPGYLQAQEFYGREAIVN